MPDNILDVLQKLFLILTTSFSTPSLELFPFCSYVRPEMERSGLTQPKLGS